MPRGQQPQGLKPGPYTAPLYLPCSFLWRHTQHPAHNTGLVFNTTVTCGWRGQSWIQTRISLLGSHTLASGPEAVVPPSALVTPVWEAQSHLDGFSITQVSPALGCLIPGMWLSPRCGGQQGAGTLVGSMSTSHNAEEGSTQVPAPAHCAAESMTAGVPWAAQNSCPLSPAAWPLGAIP